MAHAFKKDTPASLVPKLRFKEFAGAGEWEESLLGNCSSVVRGGSPRPINDFLTSEKSGLNWLKIGDVDKNAKYITHTQERVRPEARNKSREINPGDLILSNSMSFGRPYISNIKACIHDGWIAITNINKIFYVDFIYYLILSPSTQKFFITYAAGSGVLNLNADIIKSFQMLFPKKPEQQRIADCLTSLDENIIAESQKLEALTTHKKTLMQKLFPAEGEKVPALRFKEFAGAGEWEEKQLTDVADKKIKWSFVGGPFGSNLKHSDYTEQGIRIIQLQNIGEAKFIDTCKIYTSTQKADELLSCNIYPGNIILSKMGDPVGRACIIPVQDKRYLMCSDGIRLVVDERKFNKNFIYLTINSYIFRDVLEKTATGSTRKRIGLDELRKLPLSTPTLPEQQRIADCLTSIDEYITAQGCKIALLKEHKKGLMQQLFPRMEEE